MSSELPSNSGPMLQPSTPWLERSKLETLLDAFERCTMIVLFGTFVVALLGSIITSINHETNVAIGSLMLLITESMVLVFILFRKKAKNLSLRLNDWFLAYAASCLPLLARPAQNIAHYWEEIATPLTILGLAWVLLAKFTLGRRFGIVAANRGICDRGPYRLVRHPIYTGYIMVHVGFIMLSPTIWNAAVFAAFYVVLIPRIFAEERVLGQDEHYRSYMSKVKSRLIPGIF
jgi:protein-S-isoprenylcysteine O-methyltransferase Ste14